MEKKSKYVPGKILTHYYGRQLQFFRCVAELFDHVIRLTLSFPNLIHHVFDVMGGKSYTIEMLSKIGNANLNIKEKMFKANINYISKLLIIRFVRNLTISLLCVPT